MEAPASHGLAAMQFLWDQYHDTVQLTPVPKNRWLDEFFFCLLGGFSIPYELNRSAFLLLKSRDYFQPKSFHSNLSELEKELALELKKPQFTPLRKEGTYRRYRFPYKKARTIVRAGRWLLQACEFQLSELLGSGPKYDREKMLQCPGFGYKTASWFLRNIGQGSRLAILDVHVYRSLRDFGIIPTDLTVQSDYLEIESAYCYACDVIGAKVDAMDLILWSWARGGVCE